MYALISALSGLVGAIFGGLLAYFGSVQGAKRQIEYQDKRAEVEREKKRKLSIDIITTFLIPEMRHNFLEIYNDKYLHNGLINNASKFFNTVSLLKTSSLMIMRKPSSNYWNLKTIIFGRSYRFILT